MRLTRARPRSLTLLSWLCCSACSPVAMVAGHPSAPIQASSKTAPLSAELNGVNERVGSFAFSLTLSAPARARVARAALSHPHSAIDDCDPQRQACDELDSRFTGGVSAAVFSSGRDVVLLFPSFGTRQALAEPARLLLDIELEQRHYLLELDLSRERAFRASDWGLGGAVRYRAPGLLREHFGAEVSGELGVDRWFAATRLRLNYEIGFAGCQRGDQAERAHCQGKDLVLPFGFGLNATQYLRLDPRLTLGLSLGYEGVAVFGRFRSPDDRAVRADPFLHGPRFALLLTRTPRAVPRFVAEPPKTSAGFELSLELLGRRNFEQPVLLPGIGYSYTFGF